MNFGFRRHMLMNEAILGDAGGGTPPPANTDPASTGGDPSWTAPEWAKGTTVDAEILRSPMFQSVKGMDDVIKGYYHAQKMVGADKVIVPTKSSTPEQWKEYYQKGGLPASMEDYKAEFPATIEDKEFQANLSKKAYELNIRPDQLQAIVAEMEGYNDKIVQSYEAEEKEAVKATAIGLKKEWGADYERNLLQAQRVITHFGGEDTLKAIMQSPLASDGQFLRLMKSISGSLTKEDTFQQNVVTRFGTSAEEASKQINAIYGDTKSPYYDEGHAQHRDVVNKMLDLQKILAESQQKA